MSIVRMKKLSVIGLASVREELMERLMRLGVVEISAQDAKLTDSEWKDLVSQDGNEGAVAGYEARIANVRQTLDAILRYGIGKPALFNTRKPVERNAFEKVLEGEDEIEKKVDHIVSLSNKLSELVAAENKTETGRLSLLPWKGYDIPLEIPGTKETDVLMGVVPVAVNVDQLLKELGEKIERCVAEPVGSDTEQHYISVLCLKSERSEVEDILRVYGFNRTVFGELQGTAAENLAAYEKKLASLAEEKAQVEEAIRAEEGEKQNIEYLYDSLIVKRDQAMIRSRLLVTKRAFYLDGWVPRAAAAQVEKLLTENGCHYELEDPAKDEETPVLLQNGGFAGPFESVTKLYALPISRGIDPTPFFSLSYAIFFGMMLGDTAYGAIMTAATFLVLKKFKLEGMKHQLIKMLFYCGIATMFWGVMFGGYFGDVVTVAAKLFFNANVVIPPLWFNPMEDPMKLLIFSFILGAAHLFIGMGLSAYMSIRDGRPFDAFCDVFLWYIFLIGLVLLLLGAVAPLGKWMSIIGAVGIFLTAGRARKGIGKVIGGLSSLYGVTGYLSDVLSYSRLLGLGLASAVIASVVNTIGAMAGGGIVGLIVFIIAFVIGHTYNMAINGLGSFVHSCRLQYVEFFGKFYEPGGEAFEPFAEKTKYIEILREEI